LNVSMGGMGMNVSFSPGAYSYGGNYDRRQPYQPPMGVDPNTSYLFSQASQIFRQTDADHSGQLSYNEFRNAMGMLGMYNGNEQALQQVFWAVDKDRSGSISEREFCEYYVQAKGGMPGGMSMNMGMPGMPGQMPGAMPGMGMPPMGGMPGQMPGQMPGAMPGMGMPGMPPMGGMGMGMGMNMGMPGMGMPFSLLHSRQSPRAPPNSPAGFQNDGAGQLFCAVAHTPNGNIPGKAKDGNCWYPYGGSERSTTDFSWVVAPGARQVQGPRPPGALAVGHQNDGAGTLYSAIAITPHGNIPGKAKDGNCWYPYGGKEHSTTNFFWVTM